MNSPDRLAQRLQRQIATDGPLPVSQYVEMCLYDQTDGFYMRAGGGRAGAASGHFLTAPEVGPLFGAVLARALDVWWAELGKPERFTVIDWGAGPGTLARSLLAAEPECMARGALRLVLVELSPTQRALHPSHRLVTSVAQVHDALPEDADGAGVAVGAGVVLANELLDNLPFDVVCRVDSGWEELRVTVADRGDGFELEAAPASSELVAGLGEVPVGSVVPVQHAARLWVDEARDLLSQGRVVVFDYGAETSVLAERCFKASGEITAGDDSGADFGWLRTHRSHESGASWLADPGSCDVTTDVALDQVQAEHPAVVCSQAQFLRDHGIDLLVAEGQALWSQRSGVGDLAALTARSRVREAEALLDPDGMGAFNVLQWPATPNPVSAVIP